MGDPWLTEPDGTPLFNGQSITFWRCFFYVYGRITLLDLSGMRMHTMCGRVIIYGFQILALVRNHCNLLPLGKLAVLLRDVPVNVICNFRASSWKRSRRSWCGSRSNRTTRRPTRNPKCFCKTKSEGGGGLEKLSLSAADIIVHTECWSSTTYNGTIAQWIVGAMNCAGLISFRHVIVCGHVTAKKMTDFLQEFYVKCSPYHDRRHSPCNTPCMAPDWSGRFLLLCSIKTEIPVNSTGSSCFPSNDIHRNLWQ